jgi:hypothetical protein
MSYSHMTALLTYLHLKNERHGDGTPCYVGNISHTLVVRIVQTVAYWWIPYTAVCKSCLQEISEAHAAYRELHILQVLLKALNYVLLYFSGFCLVTMDFGTVSMLLQKPQMRHTH